VRLAVENLSSRLSEDERELQSRAATAELERLSLLVENVLDMAHLDAGAVKVVRQWVTAADVIDAALAHVRRTLEGHQLRVDAGDDREAHVDPKLTPRRSRTCSKTPAGTHPRRRHRRGGARAPDGLHLSVTDQGRAGSGRKIERLLTASIAVRRPARHARHGMGLHDRARLRVRPAAASGRDVAGGGARFSLSVPASPRG
jgi:two-component system sensor histidine kinase KdpD